MLVAELLNLLCQLPVQVIALAFCGLGLLVSDITQNLGTHWAVRWEHFLDGAGGKVHTRLGHHRMHNLGCTEEVRTPGGIIPQARALESLFVLLVPLLAGFLVFLDQIKVSHTDLLKVKQVDGLRKVLVEVWILFWPLVVAQCHDGRAVLQLFDILILFFQVSNSTTVFGHL